MWTWLRKVNLNRETESFLTTAQNQTITTNLVKAKIDNTQENSKNRERDETMNYIARECRKLAQKKREIRYDWVGHQCNPMRILQKIKTNSY